LGRAFREVSDAALMMLVPRVNSDTLLKALEMGADVCLPKPVPVRILRARVKALLRRASGKRLADPGQRIYHHPPLTIDFQKEQVAIRGQPVDLSPTEYKLLTCMVHHRGHVLPHQFLATQLWGPEASARVHTLRCCIKKLRLKIEPDPAQPTLIKNQRGVGYRFG